MTDAEGTTTIDFWFDPTCPWAWMTSRWMDEVAQHRDFDVTWHIMSLAILNEGRDLPPEYLARMPRALHYARVVAAAQALHGDHVVKPLYDAFGKRIHLEQRSDEDTIIAESLAEAGLPAEVADHASPAEGAPFEFQDELLASHTSGMKLVGDDVGTPIIAVNGTAFFGPVISPAPKGKQALALWDGIVAAASYDGFFELKRTRTRRPIFD